MRERGEVVDDVRRRLGHGARHGRRVEQVDPGGAGGGDDIVALGRAQRREVRPREPGRAGDEDAHQCRESEVRGHLAAPGARMPAPAKPGRTTSTTALAVRRHPSTGIHQLRTNPRLTTLRPARA